MTTPNPSPEAVDPYWCKPPTFKDRPAGFLAEDKIDHQGLIFDYITELHSALWKFVGLVNPPCGKVTDEVIPAWKALYDKTARAESLSKALADKTAECEGLKVREKTLLSDMHTMTQNRVEELRQAESSNASLRREIAELVAQKNGAYSERNKLVAALSKLFPASLERHEESDKTWEDDWRWIVFIDLPTGQVSWHIHDSELYLFVHLERRAGRKWDGHDTPQKYSRLELLAAVLAKHDKGDK